MSIKGMEHWIQTDLDKAIDELKTLEKGSVREVHETYLASEILLTLLKGNSVSKTQIQFLKDQSFDITKAIALIGLQAVPGSSLAIIALEKIAEQHGFSLFPRAENDPGV